MAARHEYGWGAKKLLRVLRTRHPRERWPARSTVNAILERHGLLQKHRRRQTWAHPGAVAVVTHRPNQVWPADFKGQFRTGNGHYCYPLTITDHFSRRVMACHGLRSVKTVEAKPVFRALFREVGLPEAIRTDNGAPFASTGIHGLAALNVWWMQLGIVHQRITPASPQENGTHERMHRELKRETAARRPAPSAPSSAASTRSASATTTSGRTKPSAIARQARSGSRRGVPTPSTGHIPNTPRTWRFAASAPRGHSVSCRASRSSVTPSAAKTLASKKLGMGFGTSSITVRCSARSTSAPRGFPGLGPAHKVSTMLPDFC